jgi:hypothetical protein
MIVALRHRLWAIWTPQELPLAAANEQHIHKHGTLIAALAL